ncbi:TrmH family RNA methyltransferase [Sphingorhabdus sp. SMR4y]|uniref:TrmH family RNA methyltransferase n=1 Tax=Sphingorhabdus sp. SMR4y TaxID=2584094 RepID=UPI000B5CDE82|nr:RNA methyltransferase [Sphingorhabdus sp. SMR4y]ASK87745.1 23S rRNA (uridine(2479)-2'-O)-methyltransferase [Sphingorhabdus sp. SMR4y]
MRHQITGFSNPTIKRLRSLREKKHRKREGLFLAEGLRILTEALESGRTPKILVVVEDVELHPLAQEIEAATAAAGGDVIETSEAIIAKLSGKSNPQSIIGIYPDHPVPLAELDRSDSNIWLVAQALRDPGNLGTILRTGDAVGAGGLILIDDCVDPFSVEAVRASMGAVFTQQIVQARWPDFLDWLRNGPGELVGTSLNTDKDYQSVQYRSPTFLLIGNEAQGLPEDYEAACDILVKMPMMGKADSLNAAVAASVMVYEVLNQSRNR